MPPHSSLEKQSWTCGAGSQISTTRTAVSYFSPKIAIAPVLSASSYDISDVETGMFSRMRSCTSCWTARRSSAAGASGCV